MTITNEYRKLNAELHKTASDYGAKGSRNKKIVLDLVKQYGAKSVLDYGCGKGGLKNAIGKKVDVRNYDPAIPEWEDMPIPADIVVCADVMEHVEPEYIDTVIHHINSLTKKAAYFVIACRKAGRNLPDGRNTHISIHPPHWWEDRICRKFAIVRIAIDDSANVVAFVCEPL